MPRKPRKRHIPFTIGCNAARIAKSGRAEDGRPWSFRGFRAFPCFVFLTLLFFQCLPGLLSAQLAPDIKWRTIHTTHFQVHFSDGLEGQARRAAVNAEEAYARLSAELVAPRGPIDLVIADNVDFTNGFATPFPTNRIVIYAHPPISSSALRFYDEWLALVITHELTHTFQLDRARGWWRVAQRVFGRAPPFMPNAYTPSWLTEGLAVYYESRITGSGRLEGTEHGMVARASAIAGTTRRLNEISQATSRYPGGQGVYIYGSLLFDFLSETRGPEHVPEFVERVSKAPVPFFLNRAARRTFGVSLNDAWRQFQDSLRRDVVAPAPPMNAWRELTKAGREVRSPRWLDDRSILYAANTGRETPGAYILDLDGRNRRIGRRNGVEPNVPLGDGSVLYSQLEFLDLYRVRSDLYIQRGGSQTRLTRGARLAHPDARTDGGIVAVQAVPGTTRLVRVTADGRTITPITTAAPDTQWSEPRWSPEGARIAAVRRSRDGVSELVVLDTTGTVISILSRSRSVEASPSWAPDGRTIIFSSDRSGAPQLYLVETDAASGDASSALRVSNAATGISEPDIAPGDSIVTALHYRADGYHAGVAPISIRSAIATPDTTLRIAGLRPIGTLAPLRGDTSRARPYRPWRTLAPRYWLPILTSTEDEEIGVGGITSGVDVIGRHSYSVEGMVTPSTGDIAGGIGYTYAGLGNPVLAASISQISDYDPLRPTGSRTVVGYLRERTHIAALSATVRRQRVRNAASVTIGAELERSVFSTNPDDLLSQLAGDFSPREYAAAVVSAGWNNAQRPSLSISPEDGMSLSGSARRRWRRDGGEGTNTLVGAVRGYKSLNLPGFSHHALAARIAGGYMSENSTSEFGVGGTSGSSVEILPGYSVGDISRTFGVRGYPASTQEGLRAAAASLEYRAPLLLPSRGLWMLPVFFDKISMTLFADAGAAWCPDLAGVSICTNARLKPDWISSVGGELNLDAALSYDVPYRFRLGAARAFQRATLDDPRPMSVYFTLGLSF